MAFDPIPLPQGIRARFVPNNHGLTMHLLEAGFEDQGRPCILLLHLFSGRTIDVPSLFIAGKSDWGVYQRPGNFERMQTGACTNMHGCHLLDGAGHWVQQEQPEAVSRLLIQFLRQQA